MAIIVGKGIFDCQPKGEICDPAQYRGAGDKYCPLRSQGLLLFVALKDQLII